MTNYILDPPIYTTYIRTSQTSYYGNSSSFHVGKYGTYSYRGILYYSGGSIIDATSGTITMQIQNNSYNTAGTVISAYVLKKKWNIGYVSWSQANTGYSWSTAGAFGISDCEQIAIGSGYVSASATAGDSIVITLDPEALKEYYGNKNFFGFLLKGDEDDNTRVQFYGYDYFSPPAILLYYNKIYNKPIIVSQGSYIYTATVSPPADWSNGIQIPVTANGYLLVGVSAYRGISSSLVLTSGSFLQSFDLLADLTTYRYGHIFGMKSPPSGSYTLTYSNGQTPTACAIKYYCLDNIDQNNPFSGSYIYSGISNRGNQIVSPLPSKETDLCIDFVTDSAGDDDALSDGFGDYSSLDGLYQTGGVTKHAGTANIPASIYYSYRTSVNDIQNMAWLCYTSTTYYNYAGFSFNGTPSATYDEYTSAMLHFDNADGSYTFFDEIGNVWTPYRYPSTSGSGAIIKTDQKKFGVSSGYFTGSAVGDWIETSTDFAIGSNSWTCDFWIRPSFDGIESFWYNRALFGYDYNDSNYWQFFLSGSATDNQKFRFEKKESGSVIMVASGSVMPLQEDVWQHVAFVGSATSVQGYLNGNLYFNENIYGFGSYNGKFRIGNVGVSSMYRGYMDEFRLSIGIRRWTEDFTPPTYPYGEIPPSEITTFYRQPYIYSSYPWL